MKVSTIVIAALFSLVASGCEVSQVMRPLRLYDLSDGKTIEVFLRRSSPNSGKLVSAQVHDERFEGEIVLYGSSVDYKPRPGTFGLDAAKGSAGNVPDNAGLPELYGFGKDAEARPAGTAILVGSQGTTIEIVLYRISADLQYGDGVARDNKGRRYRVFLSVEG